MRFCKTVSRQDSRLIPLDRDAPSARSVDPAGIVSFVDAVRADGLELHSFMVFRAGAVVAELFWHPYAADIPHMQHSATKSWTGAAVGLAVDDGLIGLDDQVIGFFPEHLPSEISENLAAMTVRDLLTMRSGHRTGISGGEWRGLRESWVRAFLAEPVPDVPGKEFIYSSGSSYMLSAIVTKVTSRRVHDLLEERLCRPMAMAPLQWDLSPEGVSTGGNGLTCLTEDLLKFGILHMQGGLWNGTRLLSAHWVAEATRNHVENVWLAAMDGRRYLARDTGSEKREGYGYQWWMAQDGGYRASGVFGQQCIVLPRHDAVIAFTAGLRLRETRLFANVWRHLVPAFGANAAPVPLPANLALALPQGATDSVLEKWITGKTWQVEPNEDDVAEIALRFDADLVFVLRDHRGIHAIRMGRGCYADGETSMTGNKLHHEYQPEKMRVLGHFVWLDDRKLCMTWRYVETAFADTVLCLFDGDTIRVDRSVNTNAAATERPPLIGRLT